MWGNIEGTTGDCRWMWRRLGWVIKCESLSSTMSFCFSMRRTWTEIERNPTPQANPRVDYQVGILSTGAFQVAWNVESCVSSFWRWRPSTQPTWDWYSCKLCQTYLAGYPFFRFKLPTPWHCSNVWVELLMLDVSAAKNAASRQTNFQYLSLYFSGLTHKIKLVDLADIAWCKVLVGNNNCYSLQHVGWVTSFYGWAFAPEERHVRLC